MLVSSMSFRDLDRKWFLLEKKQDRKRMNRLFRLKNKKYPILVYTYIDHEAGLSLRVLGSIEVENQQAYLDKKMVEKRLDIIRYSEMENLDVSPVSPIVVKHITSCDAVEEEMDMYYAPHESMLKTRNETKLDECRDAVFPDDIKFLVITKDHKKEFLEGRIEDYDQEKDYYICTVLDDPKQELELSAGEMVELKYIERPNYQGLAYIKKHTEE